MQSSGPSQCALLFIFWGIIGLVIWLDRCKCALLYTAVIHPTESHWWFFIEKKERRLWPGRSSDSPLQVDHLFVEHNKLNGENGCNILNKSLFISVFLSFATSFVTILNLLLFVFWKHFYSVLGACKAILYRRGAFQTMSCINIFLKGKRQLTAQLHWPFFACCYLSPTVFNEQS